jgi:hypothetical protein
MNLLMAFLVLAFFLLALLLNTYKTLMWLLTQKPNHDLEDEA